MFRPVFESSGGRPQVSATTLRLRGSSLGSVGYPGSRLLKVLCAVLFLLPGCGTGMNARPADEAALAVEQLAKTTRSWNGAELPPFPQGQPEVTILRIGIPAGARLPLHRHPVINAGVLLSGQLTVVTVDGKRLQLKAGDPIVEVVETLHYGVNEGSVPAEIVVFYAGAAGMQVTVIETKDK